MRSRKLLIETIPAILYGGRKQEKDRFNPWCVVPELKTVLRYLQQNFKTIGLRANSIGAWFAMESFDGSEFDRCLFVSPVLDMEKLTQNMMQWQVHYRGNIINTQRRIPSQNGSAGPMFFMPKTTT